MHLTLRVAVAAAIACPALAAQDLLFTTDGPTADGALSTVAPIGDVDGDGRRDLIAGAPGSGTVQVLSGAHGAVLVTLHGPVGFGASVASAGDVDGDGRDDVAVGDPGGSGSVTVHSSATGALLRSYSGDVDGGDFGAAVLGVGDVDDDGTPDLAIGAPGWSADAGAVVIVSGADGATLLVAHGGRPGARYGAALDLGDLATDDEPGLVIGALATDDEPGLVIGSVAADDEPGLVIGLVTDDEPGLVIGSMATDDEPGLVIGAGAESQGFASVVAHADDVDGDGRTDLLVATPGLGRVSMHSSVDGSVIYDIHGGDPSSRFGAAAAVLHDVDGDAIADFAVGDPEGLGAAGRPGRVTVHSGADGRLLHVFEGGEDGGRFGASLAALLGATSGDLAVGAPGTDGGRGEVAVVSLEPDASGDSPVLLASGAITPGEVVTFSVDDAPAGAPAALVLGGALVVGDGAITPSGDVVVPGLVTDVLGRLHVTFVVPLDAQVGDALYAQVVVTSPDGTLRSTTVGGVVGG